jgi:hypothetical protein
MAEVTISELLLRWQERREEGQVFSLTDLCAGHPELVAELVQQVEALNSMQNLLQSHNTQAQPTTTDAGRRRPK